MLKRAYLEMCSQVGAGTGLPTLILFHYFLSFSNVEWTAVHLWFADFNLTVLETTTVANLLLTWYFSQSGAHLPQQGDLEITESLILRFSDDVSARAIQFTGISGAWGDRFCQLVNPSNDPKPGTDVEIMFLASETIYSIPSLRPFTEVLTRILKGGKEPGRQTRALVAAKRVYFGVGGGILEFSRCLKDYHGVATPIWESEGPGIERVILEISMDT